MSATARYFYAATYPYGVASSAETGRLLRSVYRFETRAERAEWIAQGSDRRTQGGWREAVKAGDVSAHERRNLRESDGSPVHYPEQF